MKEKEETLEKENKGKVKAFLERVTSGFLSEVKRPGFWVSCGVSILGIASIVVSTKKVATIQRENNLLKKENEKLGKQVNEAWYQAGKLQLQVINNN